MFACSTTSTQRSFSVSLPFVRKKSPSRAISADGILLLAPLPPTIALINTTMKSDDLLFILLRVRTRKNFIMMDDTSVYLSVQVVVLSLFTRYPVSSFNATCFQPRVCILRVAVISSPQMMK